MRARGGRQGQFGPGLRPHLIMASLPDTLQLLYSDCNRDRDVRSMSGRRTA